VQFHAETGGYDVTVEREDNSAHRQGPPRLFMYQVQGPRALELMERVTNGDMPEIKFFHIGNFEINGIPVRALRHGMAGSPGFEIFGDWAHADEIMAVLFEAGEGLGVRKVGGLAYPTTAVESAWMAWPVPAIYDHPDLKPYREWLKAENVEVIGSLGGSFVSDDIKDYYLRPEELGYGRFFDFNHDFIGKEALRKGVENRKREKVTLIWNREDAAEILSSSLLNKEDNAKFLETPWCGYSLYPCDEVLKDDKHVGIAQMTINSANARAFMSLAVVEMEHSAPGTELTLVWGEPDSKRPLVESHTLRKIRVVVAPAPYYEKIIAKD
jgi:vanillate/3-O-methylgallate O-demethylase